jgi:hypothetical protein
MVPEKSITSAHELVETPKAKRHRKQSKIRGEKVGRLTSIFSTQGESSFFRGEKQNNMQENRGTYLGRPG